VGGCGGSGRLVWRGGPCWGLGVLAKRLRQNQLRSGTDPPEGDELRDRRPRRSSTGRGPRVRGVQTARKGLNSRWSWGPPDCNWALPA
jgi:hypothetical protein